MPILSPERLRLVAALVLPVFCGPAFALDDIMVRESIMIKSERAAQSVLLGVTRAGQRLVAVGERGIVLLSDDDGKSWRQARVPASVTLTAVHFVSERLGWATGHSGVLLQTVDGGERWSKRLDGSQIAKIVLDAELAKNTSADPEQLAAARRLVDEGPDKPLLDVLFLSPQVGFVAGAYGLLLRTDDEGKTWSPWQSRLPNVEGRHLNRMMSTNGGMYIVGERGAAFFSNDGGNSFTELRSPYAGSFFGVVGASSDAVIIYGLRGNAFRVARRGTQWEKVDASSPATFSASVRLASGETILANQIGTLWRTKEGALSWEQLPGKTNSPVAAMAEATDGAIVVAGRGVSRVLPPEAGRASR